MSVIHVRMKRPSHPKSPVAKLAGMFGQMRVKRQEMVDDISSRLNALEARGTERVAMSLQVLLVVRDQGIRVR